jgi:hypothetical protein
LYIYFRFSHTHTHKHPELQIFTSALPPHFSSRSAASKEQDLELAVGQQYFKTTDDIKKQSPFR